MEEYEEIIVYEEGNGVSANQPVILYDEQQEVTRVEPESKFFDLKTIVVFGLVGLGFYKLIKG